MGHVSDVNLRPAADGDKERLFRWRCLEEVDRWMFSEPPETFAAHVDWFDRQRRRADVWMWIIEYRDVPVGLISLSNSVNEGVIELGIYIAERSRSGIGSAALGSALSLARAKRLGNRIRAEVFADNVRAIRLYRRFGFVESPVELASRVKRNIVRSVVRLDLDLNRALTTDAEG